MMTSKERVFKTNKVIFQLSYQKFRWQSSIKIQRLSQELFISKFQYQNSTKWWCHQWLGLILFKGRSFLGIIQKASQTKFHRITKSKVIHVQFTFSKWETTKKRGKIFLVTKRGNNIGADFRDYKSEQEGLQIGAA